MNNRTSISSSIFEAYDSIYPTTSTVYSDPSASLPVVSELSTQGRERTISLPAVNLPVPNETKDDSLPISKALLASLPASWKDYSSVIKGLVRRQEFCKFVLPGSFSTLSNAASLHSGYIALLIHRSSNAAAVLFVEKGAVRPKVEIQGNGEKEEEVHAVDILPVYNDLTVVKKEQLRFHIAYKNSNLLYRSFDDKIDPRRVNFHEINRYPKSNVGYLVNVTDTSDAMNAFLSELLKSIKEAQTLGYFHGGESHRWTKEYIIAIDTVQQTSNATPTASTTSSSSSASTTDNNNNNNNNNNNKDKTTRKNERKESNTNVNIRENRSTSIANQQGNNRRGAFLSNVSNLIGIKPLDKELIEPKLMLAKGTSSSRQILGDTESQQLPNPIAENLIDLKAMEDHWPLWQGEPEEDSEEKSHISNKTIDDVRNQCLQSLIQQREEEFTETKLLSLMLCTWNVNGRKPEESLQDLLFVASPDIYAIGFQELDLSAENFLLGTSSYEHLWQERIEETLKEAESKYVMLEMKRLVGILLFIYIKMELLSYVCGVQIGEAAVGIMGMMGNKGGVAIRFSLFDSTFCIVNCHLNAHAEGVQRRNQDYHDISRRVIFSGSSSSKLHHYPLPDSISSLLIPFTATVDDQHFTVFDHDFLFWIGDLNYRLNNSNEMEIKQKIKEEKWSELLESDQLLLQISSSNAFQGFYEGPINFGPTYKYEPGTNQYASSEKARIPAWCDRILWRTLQKSDLRLVRYSRAELHTSDHKPVYAIFEVKVKRIVPEKRTKIYQDAVHLLDRMENEHRPTATISSNVITFENVKYGVPCSQSITLENIGKVLTKFQFIPKLNEGVFCKPWLHIQPSIGLITPGEKLTVHFTVLLDSSIWLYSRKTLLKFNMLKEKLDDILILHLDGGVDFFITITGNYLPSCFGHLLSMLVRLHRPIRESISMASEPLSIPKELWRIVDYLYRKGMDTENLFLESGVVSEMPLIRECLDTGDSFEKYVFSPHSVAETLIHFLESLAVPVMCFRYHELQQLPTKVYGFTECDALAKQYLRNTAHYNTFYYIIAFLREVLLHKESNCLTPNRLAMVFSNVLIRSFHSRTTFRIQPQILNDFEKRKAEFIETFLKSDHLDTGIEIVKK